MLFNGSTSALAGVISGLQPELGSVIAYKTTLGIFVVQIVFTLLATILRPGIDTVGLFQYSFSLSFCWLWFEYEWLKYVQLQGETMIFIE